jgi:hypothetical protein
MAEVDGVPGPVPECWHDPELAQDLIASYGSVEAAAVALAGEGGPARPGEVLEPGWTFAGVTEGGGRLFVAPMGTALPDGSGWLARAVVVPAAPAGGEGGS